MTDKHETATPQFRDFQESVIDSAIFPASIPLDVAAYQCMEHLSPREIARVDEGAFQRVKTGWRWGPRWSTAWFRVSGIVPLEFAGHEIVLRFSSGTEAQVWVGGEPMQGLDANRDVYRLFGNAEGGERVDLLVEAACNHRLGQSLFHWDSPEFHEQWKQDLPGILERCELAIVDERVRSLQSVFAFTRLLLDETPSETGRFTELETALKSAIYLIDQARVGETAEKVKTVLESALRGRGSELPTHCFTVGHGHLDTAWLWRIRETKRKCTRTFSNVLELMDRFPEFHFLCSQPQQYAWVKLRSPVLYERICNRVREGRWEPMGAMWIEPDGNLPSGESFVRQILMGTRFFEREFGDRGRQRLLYLPDTFGFAASLPQIMKLAGLDTFITNKLWWSETNVFPYSTFKWKGIDGTEILSHLTPGQEYNATNTPKELLHGKRLSEKHDTANVNVWLQPYGFGDGGGGPTDWTIEYAQFAENCEGIDQTNQTGAEAFCDALHARASELNSSLPVWEGELYLEKHRGTFTTQAQIKRANCEAESALRTAEWLSFAGPQLDEDSDKSIQGDLTEAWGLTLLNQFHDILPGSSIAEVYEDAAADHACVREICNRLISDAARRWTQALLSERQNNPAESDRVVVFNPSSSPRSGWVPIERISASRDEAQTQPSTPSVYAHDVPALGMKTISVTAIASAKHTGTAAAHGRVLSNGTLEAHIDEAGRIAKLVHIESGTDAAQGKTGSVHSSDPSRLLNQLALYTDTPQQWEAWDIDADYVESEELITSPADDISSGEDESGAFITTSRRLGDQSTIVQTYRLRTGSPRLDIETWIDWRERQRLLRVLFPIGLRTNEATYEIPFGHIQRSTLRKTAIEQAQFEVPAHRWMDISEPGYGIALLNNCKYGHSCESDDDMTTMGLTLLRGPNFPDPNADLGEHRFMYSLMPHCGDWRAAGVDREAEAITSPMFAVWADRDPAQTDSHASPIGAGGDLWGPVRVTSLGEAQPRVTAWKRAEDDARRIVRLVEWHGKSGRCQLHWGFPIESVEHVDLLERPMAFDGMEHDSESGVTTIDFKPFQIVTLAVRPAAQ